MEKKYLSHTSGYLVNFLRGECSYFPEVIRWKHERRLMLLKRALKTYQCVSVQHKTERSLEKQMMSHPLLGLQHLDGCPAPSHLRILCCVKDQRISVTPSRFYSCSHISPVTRLWLTDEIKHLEVVVKASSQQTDVSSFGSSSRSPLPGSRASLVSQLVKNPPATWKTWVWSLGWEDPLKEGLATHSSILAWRIPMDRGTWWATVHGVAKSWTWLTD